MVGGVVPSSHFSTDHCFIWPSNRSKCYMLHAKHINRNAHSSILAGTTKDHPQRIRVYLMNQITFT